MQDTPINRKALIRLMEELIQINSVNPSLSDSGAGEADIARHIGAYLDNLGLEVHYQELQKNRSSPQPGFWFNRSLISAIHNENGCSKIS